MEVSGQLHPLADLPLRTKPPVPHWVGGWVDLRVGLDAVMKMKAFYPYRQSNLRSSNP